MEPPSLLDICIKDVIASDFWRVQRRQLLDLPEDAANRILDALLQQHRVGPPQLELFQLSVTELRLHNAYGIGSGSEWLAYATNFRCLRRLELLECHRLKPAVLRLIVPLAPSLQALSLEGCRSLTPPATQYLQHLTLLTSLKLTGTQVGSLPPAVVAELPKLKVLALGGLPTTNMTCQSLASLADMQSLELWGSSVTDVGVAHLSALRHLSFLSLSWTAVTLFPPVPFLRHLEMGHCHFAAPPPEGPHPAPQLPLLEELLLPGAAFDAAAEPELGAVVRGAAGRLRKLDLQGCHIRDVPFLAAASCLEELDLSGSRVRDWTLEPLQALQQLVELRLIKTRITSIAAAHLMELPRLAQLALRETQMAEDALPMLLRLPSLAALDLSGAALQGDLSSLVEIASAQQNNAPRLWPELKSLRLLDVGITEAGLARILSLAPGLTHLSIGTKAVSDAGCTILWRLPGLQSLELADWQVTDVGLARLEGLQALHELHIRNCWFASHAAVSELGHWLPALRKLSFNGEAVELKQLSLEGTPPSSKKKGRSSSSRELETPGQAGATRSSSRLWLYDERLKYSQEELLSLREEAGPAAAAGAAEQLIAALPAELRMARTD